MLTLENYKNGFLIDEEVIGGVTEMAGGVYSAYVSHYLTGETLAYQEFNDAAQALEYLRAMKRSWKFEGVGCGKISAPNSKSAGGSCRSGACNSCACG